MEGEGEEKKKTKTLMQKAILGPGPGAYGTLEVGGGQHGL
jgi:hypothetical protein